MSFFPQAQQRIISPVGRVSSKIAIVGDYTSPFDDKALLPFSGPAGSVLEQCLHAAGLIKGEVYMTNLFKTKAKGFGNKRQGPAPEFFDESRGTFTAEGSHHVSALRDELNRTDANVIIAAGAAAFAALCGLRRLSMYRGYVFESRGLAKIRKVIPTHHPASAMRGMYTYRYMIVTDLKKAKGESVSPELVRPDRRLVYDYASVNDALDWLDYYKTREELAVDIEVNNFEISCISFSAEPEVGCVIPLNPTEFRPQGWTLDEEVLLFRSMQEVLGNEKSKKVLQNGIFDIQFMLANIGLEVRGEVCDTMIAHHVVYPELPKGLGFLGSIYCGAQEYWKDSVKFENIKEES